MSVATEIQRLQLAKEDIKSAIIEKGGTVEKGALIDSYGDAIRGIEVGGGGDISKFGIQNEVTGTGIVTCDYVNENEHNVEVKLSSDTVTDFSGVEVVVQSENFFDISKYVSDGQSTNNGDGSITLVAYATQIKNKISECCPNIVVGQTIIISGTNVGNTYFGGTIMNANKAYTVTQAMLDNNKIGFYGINGTTTADNPLTISDIMINVGTVDKPYEEYFEKTYLANADGTVDGVTSISPIMNIICDGVNIHARYYCRQSVEYDTFWDSIYEQMKKSTYRLFNGGAWNDTTFQPPRDIVLAPDSRFCFNSMNIKNLRNCIDDRGLKIDFTNVKIAGAFFADSTSLEHVGEIDLSTLVNEVELGDTFQRCTELVTVDKIKFCSNAKIKGSPFHNCRKLENVTFEGEFCLSIAFDASPLLSDASVQNIIDGLADLTGKTTQTLTFHADVKAKLTDEQIATITSKNWTLA